ncbi:hypothetical protein ACHAWO_013962 [Cyclotella atomus]|uniref:Phosphodiesterase n=1 Tax=Cyclotella atomus TaxID=382360 RepID=A0ABD3MRL7_9STRA
MSSLNASHLGSIHSSISSFRPTFISPRRRTTLTRERQRSALTNSRGCRSISSSIYTASKFSLEECVAEIESILDDPGISTLLNSNQTNAIEGLRDRINQCQQLLAPRETDGGGCVTNIPAKVLENLDDANCGFLASNFGGLKLSESQVTLFESIVDNEEVCGRMDDLQLYAPAEWDRLSEDVKRKLADTLSLKNLDRWDFDILDVVENVERGSVLVIVGWAILASPDAQRVILSSIDKDYDGDGSWGGYNFASSLGVNHEKLCSFLRSLESQYDCTEKYHNNIHAADVTQTLHSMIRMGAQEFSNALNPLDIYSILLAAAAHDVGHPGTNNMYQVNAQTNLAIVYNDKSPLENMHASKSSQIIKQLGLLDNFSSEQQTHARSRMILAILGTDMSHHFNEVSYMEEFISQFEVDGVNWYDYVNTEENSTAIQNVLNYMIHLADISNPTKTKSLAVYWAECALSEFFAQGDLEKVGNLPVSPLCDREKTNLASSQRDFIRFVVLPSYEVLGRILPGVADEVLPRIKENLGYWESRCQTD